MREARIREVLARHGKLAVPIESVGPDIDLYDLGMTSHATVSVMVALEDEFDVEFPDSMLNGDTFQTIATIDAALDSLGS